MKKSLLLKKEAFLVFFAAYGMQSMAQQPMRTMQVATYNLTSFTPQQSYKNLETLYSVNAPSDVANPDFGKVAPRVNPTWYEQYGKRTATSRSFIAEDRSIVSGNSYSPVNYRDKNGNYIAINPLLSASGSGWSALHQEFPTFLHVDGSTEISLSENDHVKFNFNNSFAGINLSVNNFTVGDNGMMIHDAIAGVDKRIVFKENKIETDYLLNKPLSGVSGDLVISEEIILPAGYSIKEKNLDALFGVGSDHFEMVVVNENGTECAHFKMPVCYDSNKDKSKRKQSICYGKYQLRNNGGKTFLDVIVPSGWLTDAGRIYPVTIDPVVTGPMSVWAGGVINSCYTPSYNTALLNVTVPANITITNFYVSASYYADPSTITYESDGYMYFTTACGRDPQDNSLYWTVSSPGGDVSGTAYLSMQDMGSTEAFCMPPSCSQRTLPLTMNLGRTWDLYGFYDCDAFYIYYDPSQGFPYEAYIVGRSAELAGGPNSWTVSPTTLCANVCTLNLSATVSGGVPPYTMTHPWAVSDTTFGAHTANTGISTGIASLTLNIPNCPSTCGTSAGLSIAAPLIVDACGNTVSLTASQNVTQNPIPVIMANPVSTSVCSGTPASIVLTSCVAGASITWTGSNGSSGSGNIVNSPVNGGGSNIIVNYTANVSINGCAGTPVIIPVTVYPVPAVSVSPPAPVVCGEKSVTITASGGNTYSWSPSGGLSPATGDTVSANPVSTTIYTVTGTDGNGCTNSTNVTVGVHTAAVISVSPPAPSYCGAKSILLTANGGVSYTWGPSNGLSATSGTTVTANPASTNTYIITGTDANGCTNTSSVTVTVNPLPSVNVNPPSASICGGQAVLLTAGGATTYSWSPSAGLYSTGGDTVTANPLILTTYTVIGTDGKGCSNTATSTVTITSAFALNAGPDVNICHNGSTLITVTGVSGGSTYSWSPSTNLTCSNCSNPTANPVGTTTYIVTATSPTGCQGTDTITVIVTPLSAKVTLTDTLVCSGSIIQLNASGGINYAWSPSTDLSDSTIANPIAIPIVTTTYTVTVSSGNCSSTATVTINTFPPLPSPTITQSGDTLTCSTSPQYTSYQWYFNTSTIAGATTSTYVATQSGNYNIAVQDENGCSISVGINIVLSVGLKTLSSDHSISLFPNPAGKELMIMNEGLRIEKTEIYNMLGEKIYAQPFEAGNTNGKTTIDISALAVGIYLLQVQTQEEKWIGRFVKE